tara:strand:- start:1549 stop:2151 length:603 start_codon:yes stop_codon:yes gene_type:complete
MPWNIKKKILFVHIPKTGGTTIEIQMGARPANMTSWNIQAGYGWPNNKAIQHYTCKEYQIYKPDIYKEYWKFSIVRHPFNRFISDMNMNPVLKNKDIDIAISFVENIVINKLYNDNLYYDHFKPQTDFIYDEENNLLVDKLFRYEEFNTISKNTHLHFINTNIKIHSNYPKKFIHLNKIQQQRIFRLYQRDFELLQYNYP